MKNVLIIFLFTILTCLGCKDDDTPVVDPIQERIELLAKTWVPNTGSAVTVDGIDVSSEFNGFTFRLEIGEEPGIVALRLSGPDGTKEFIDYELGM